MSEFGVALGLWDQLNLEMHLEFRIEQVWTCTLRSGSSEHGDELRGRDRASLEIPSLTMFIGNPRGRHDQDNSEIHLDAVIDHDWRSMWRRLIWS